MRTVGGVTGVQKASHVTCCEALDPDCVPDETYHVDFVIVGLGTAGATLARGLADNRDYSVLAIEAGADTRADPVILSADITGTFLPRQYHWVYPANPADVTQYAALGLVIIPYEEGRQWGGGSGHNYLLAVRGSPAEYDEWGTVNPRWSYSNALPFMKGIETYSPLGTGIFNAAQRGAEGRLFVTQDNVAIDQANTFVVQLGVAGAPYTADYNDPSLGIVVTSEGQFYLNPTTFERSWAASASLGPDVVEVTACGGMGRGGRQLRIFSNAVAIKLLYADLPIDPDVPQVIGVRFVVADKIVDAFARREVISCAGSAGDTMLLQRSGIGPAALLESLGIPVVLDQPNVGANLQNHYGPTVILPAIIGDLTIPPLGVSFFDLGTGERQFQYLFNGPVLPGGTTIFGYLWNLQPSRLGTIELSSKAPDSNPLITFRFWQDPDDLARAVAMLKKMADISLAYSGLMPIAPPTASYPPPYGPAPDDTLLEDYCKANTTITNHNSGACRMATSAADGVVDGRLRVHGIRGLSICSNAVAPTIERGNTAWSAYVLGAIKADVEGGIVPTA